MLLCLVLPMCVLLFIWHSQKRGKLTDSALERHYGFMCKLWRNEVCWCQTVVVLQTIGLAMIAAFGLGPYYQALVTVAVLNVVVVLLLWVRPFKCRADNAVAVRSVFCCLHHPAHSLSCLTVVWSQAVCVASQWAWSCCC